MNLDDIEREMTEVPIIPRVMQRQWDCMCRIRSRYSRLEYNVVMEGQQQPRFSSWSSAAVVTGYAILAGRQRWEV
jgi:hypothetical protein